MLKPARRHRLASQRLILLSNLFMQFLTPPAFGVSTRQPSFPRRMSDYLSSYILAYYLDRKTEIQDNGEVN